MREIMFRGKALQGGEWVFGDYMSYAGGAQIWMHDPDGGTHNVLVDPATVGQYAGQTDKNGKKIFEGDIVKAIWWHSNNVDTVVGKAAFHDASFVLEAKGCFLFFGDNVLQEDCEVIGNVWDSLELLRRRRQVMSEMGLELCEDEVRKLTAEEEEKLKAFIELVEDRDRIMKAYERKRRKEAHDV